MPTLIDLTDRKFGRLTVIGKLGRRSRYVTWLCRCDCGTQITVMGASLLNGNTRSCGCLRKDVVSSLRLIDLTGKKYGRLTVIERSYEHYGQRTVWRCRCECGKIALVDAHKLRSGHTKSCGCYRNEFKALPKGEAAFNNLFNQYIKTAARAGRVFKVSGEQFRKLIQMPCHYCGAEPATIRDVSKRKNGDRQLLYNGLDRVDNAKGYILSNVVPCCPKCNRAKMNMAYDEFIALCKRIANRHRSKHVPRHCY